MPTATPTTIPATAPVETPGLCGVRSCGSGEIDKITGEDDIEVGDDIGHDTEDDVEGYTDDSESDTREVARLVKAKVENSAIESVTKLNQLSSYQW